MFWEAHRRYHYERLRQKESGLGRDGGETDDENDDVDGRGGKGGSVPDESKNAKGGARSERNRDPSNDNRPENRSGGEGVKGIDYPLGTECCDDLEWDDEEYNLLRPSPIIRPPHHVRIAGVTHSLGAESCDDLEWDDDEYQLDRKRAQPVFLLALGKHQREGRPLGIALRGSLMK